MLKSNHICVKITASRNLRRPLKPHYPVLLKLGNSGVSCNVLLVGTEQLAAGETGFAQLLCEAPIETRRGIEFALLEKNNPDTVASGAVIIPGLPRLHKVNAADMLILLKSLDSGDHSSALAALVAFYSPSGVSRSFIIRSLGLSGDEIDSTATRIEGFNWIELRKDKLLMSDEDMKHWTSKVVKILKEYHIAHPSEPGLAFDPLRNLLKPPPPEDLLRNIIDTSVSNGILGLQGEFIHLPDFKPRESNPLEGFKGVIFEYYRQAGYSPSMLSETAKALAQPQKRVLGILQHLVELGYIVRLDKTTFISRDAFDKAWLAAERLLDARAGLPLGEFRDSLGCSRRIALLILERFDKKGWTTRQGNSRARGPKSPR